MVEDCIQPYQLLIESMTKQDSISGILIDYYQNRETQIMRNTMKKNKQKKKKVKKEVRPEVDNKSLPDEKDEGKLATPDKKRMTV